MSESVASQSLMLRVLKGEASAIPPIWMMRQAGRYLPEYRKLRAEAGSFLDLCMNPELAAEVTLQPVRRYDLDAAILFADILLLPYALGQKLWFEEGEGPRLDPVMSPDLIKAFRDRDVLGPLAPVFEAVAKTRAALAPDKTLLGFAGAPWTVATYMLAGRSVRDPSALRIIAWRDPAFVDALLDLLVEKTVAYLIAQVDAGADAIQIFDTWAGGLPESLVERLSVGPMDRIAEGVKKARPGTPVIFFPRGVGAIAQKYAVLPACDAISIDTGQDWGWAKANLCPHATVQGGLDPLLPIIGGDVMLDETRRLLDAFAGAPYIFNLGHGLTPETPPENVGALVDFIRKTN